jgi:DNA-binding response OmpR family regulator
MRMERTPRISPPLPRIVAHKSFPTGFRDDASRKPTLTIADGVRPIRLLPVAVTPEVFRTGIERLLLQHPSSFVMLAVQALTDFAVAGAKEANADVLLLDCNGLRGSAMCRAVARVRTAGWNGPIFVILSPHALHRLPVAMTLGATDFVLSTTSAAEIEARVRRTLHSANGDQTVSIAPLPDGSRIEVQWRTREIICDGIRIVLAYRELQLFAAFLERIGLTLTIPQIGQVAWNKSLPPDGIMVTSYICLLRKKLAPFGDRFGIRTIRRVGYRFEIAMDGLSATLNILGAPRNDA